MKKAPSKAQLSTLKALLLAMMILVTSSASALAQAGDVTNGQIAIDADKLTADSQGRYALFSGNVRIERDGTVLTADRVKLNYSDEQTDRATEKGLSTIEADGSVTMSFDGSTATAERAVYDTRKEEVILTGGPPTIISQGSSMTGTSITINRTNGAIAVESDASQRVKVKLVPGKDGFALPSQKK